MEISNCSRLNTNCEKPTKLNTKTITANNRSCTSMPAVSPAYFSPSFMGNSSTHRFNAWTWCNTDKRYSPNGTIYRKRQDIFKGWNDFLNGNKDYTKDEKIFIVDDMFKYCERENYVIPPKPDKDTLDITWGKYKKRKDEGSDDTFDFNTEYRKELQLKDWRKNLLFDESKYDRKMCHGIIDSLAENNEPENIPAFDRVIFDITINQYNAMRESSDREEELEGYDFNKEYKTNLVKFTDENDRVLGATDEYTEIYLDTLRNNNKSYILESSYTNKPKLSQAKETEDNEKKDDVDIGYVQSLMQANQAKYTDVVGDVILDEYRLTRCGNNNYAGGMEGVKEERIAESGFKTLIDLNALSDSDKNLIIWENEPLTVIYFDINGYDDQNDTYSVGLWSNPAFKTKSYFETEKLMKLERYKKFYTPSETKEEKKKIKEDVDVFDDNCREFIDDFTTVVHYLNEGRCYMGCHHGVKVTEDMLVLDYYFNPKSDYGKNTIYDILNSDSNSRVSTVQPSFARKAYQIKCLYDKLTPEDKKKMGWNEEFDKNFMTRLNGDVGLLGKHEQERYNIFCRVYSK